MGRKELAVKKVGALNIREVAARATLRNVRQQGHVYVELRTVPKRSIFFCTLCRTQCFSEDVLYAHLKGNLHSKRYASAKLTLLLPNPWPFNDGVLFFNDSGENDLSVMLFSESQRAVVSVADDGRYGVTGNENGITSRLSGCSTQDCTDLTTTQFSSGRHGNTHGRDTFYENVRKCKGVRRRLSIPYVLHYEEISYLDLKIIGYGHVNTNIHEGGDEGNKFSKIWCAWLGDGNSDGCDDILSSPKCDFAIVDMSYTFDLGKKCVVGDDTTPPSPDSFFQIDEPGSQAKRKKKSFSDPEDSFNHERYQNVGCCSSDKSLSRMHTRILLQNLRKQKPSSAERNCDICQQPLLQGRDVGTLLNLKTSRFACGSRNINGAFHLFHVSCLIHWVLFCEFELWIKQTMDARGARGRKRKASVENSRFSSIFCPECQGTGTTVEGDALEKPSIPLSEIFLYKLRVADAQKTWMRSPENLQRCSTGIGFPCEATMKLQENVMPAKLLLFYRAGE